MSNVQKFFASKQFKEMRKLPIDTAQCEQLQGWGRGNFTREIMGINS